MDFIQHATNWYVAVKGIFTVELPLQLVGTTPPLVYNLRTHEIFGEGPTLTTALRLSQGNDPLWRDSRVALGFTSATMTLRTPVFLLIIENWGNPSLSLPSMWPIHCPSLDFNIAWFWPYKYPLPFRFNAPLRHQKRRLPVACMVKTVFPALGVSCPFGVFLHTTYGLVTEDLAANNDLISLTSSSKPATFSGSCDAFSSWCPSIFCKNVEGVKSS